jgi:hypothetical protein
MFLNEEYFLEWALNKTASFVCMQFSLYFDTIIVDKISTMYQQTPMDQMQTQLTH